MMRPLQYAGDTRLMLFFRFRSLFLLALLLIFCRLPVAAQDLHVSRLQLQNGLTILALEDHTVPSIAYTTVFKVGSRNERPGITGLSHLFEHMMFNGSAKMPPKQLDQTIESGGGSANGNTTQDRTVYDEEFSVSILDAVLRIEADRMRALRLDTANLEQERGVVKEERRVSVDNRLGGAMSELLWNSAFLAHPYRWDVVGFMKDLDAITLADAKTYFRTFYAPNNAVVAIVGDFDTKTLLAQMERAFGDIPRGPARPPVINAEPVQMGERRAAYHHVAALSAVQIGFRGVANNDPDAPALDVLSQILSSGESSRLYHRLVYTDQLATYAFAVNEALKDPGLFILQAQARPGHTAAECESALYAVLEEIKSGGVSERELQKAKNGIRVGLLNRFKTNLGRAGLLAEAEATRGDWKRVQEDLPLRDRVTAADVQRVARKYFSERSRTVVTLFPENTSGEDAR